MIAATAPDYAAWLREVIAQAEESARRHGLDDDSRTYRLGYIYAAAGLDADGRPASGEEPTR